MVGCSYHIHTKQGKSYTGPYSDLTQHAHPDELELETPIWIESDISGILYIAVSFMHQHRLVYWHSCINSHISLALLGERTLARRLEGLLHIDSLFGRCFKAETQLTPISKVFTDTTFEVNGQDCAPTMEYSPSADTS